MSNTPITVPAHTYVVVATVATDGTPLVDRPIYTRIVGVYPPLGRPGGPQRYQWAEAIDHCTDIRRADNPGWAIATDAATLYLYEPEFDRHDVDAATSAATERATAQAVIAATIAALETGAA